MRTLRTVTFFFSVLATICAAAFAAEDTVKIKTIPAIEPMATGKISPAYNWILKDRIRGIYGYVNDWDNTALMDNIQASGFNTMIVHINAKAMTEDGWPQEAAAWANVQKVRKIRVIASWPYGSDARYSNTQFGAYDTGTSDRWTRSPCPMSTEYWNKVVGDRAVVAAEAGLVGLVVDPEMYGADKTGYPGPCCCDTCWGRFFRENVEGPEASSVPATERAAWIESHEATRNLGSPSHFAQTGYAAWQEAAITRILQDIRKRVREVNANFLLGNLGSIEFTRGLARGFGTPEMPALIFGEREYFGRDEGGWFNVSKLPERVENLKKDGYSALFVSGLWPLQVIPPDFPKVALQIGAPYAGYWVWSTAGFTWGAGKGEYAHSADYTHDDYWKAFRVTNDAVTSYLKSRPKGKEAMANTTTSHAQIWRLKKPVPQPKPVKLGKLSPAFDWVTRERVRAMFGYMGQWKNAELLDNVVKSGFNTFLFHTMSTTMTEDGWPREAAEWAKVQNERKLRIITSWPYGSDERYGNTQFGAYNPGTTEVWKNAPCPLSKDYWDKVVGDRAVIGAKAGLTGMVVDMEMYGADRTRYSGPCYCDTCWGRFADEYVGADYLRKLGPTKRAAWMSDNGLWENYERWQEIEVTAILKSIEKRVHAVNPDFIFGNLLDPESVPGMSRGFGTSTMPMLIFSELEYHGNVTGVTAKVKQLKNLGHPALYVPGLWIQPVTPPQLPKLVVESAPQSAGYWIWGTEAFNPKAGGEYAHSKDYTDDDYWKAFQTANSDLINVLKSGGKTATTPEPKVPIVRVPRVKGEPTTDADWSKGAVMEKFVDTRNGKPAHVATTARALWDGKWLYLKAICDEPTPEKMFAPSGDRDNGNLWAQESIEVFWKRPDGDTVAHVIVNNAGTVADSLIIGMRPESPGWNPDIKTSVTMTDKGWELALCLPIDQDGAGKISPGGTLRLEIARNRPGGGETTCWAPVGGMYKSAPHLWGILTLE